MNKLIPAIAVCSALAVAGCTTEQGAVGGALAGAAIGGVATNSVAGAIVGAGVGALAGAVLVQNNNNGWCTYRYHGRYYRDRCR
jgi:hypothetical protein